MNAQIDTFLAEGCGRCALGGTPQCKVHAWQHVLALVRSIVLETNLTEELKWGVPCYTFGKHNIVILSALKDCVVLGFFKGALLKDTAQLLTKPGENSQAARQFRFRSTEEVWHAAQAIKAYIAEAIGLEEAGAQINFSEKHALQFPEELLRKFDEHPAFKAAFLALTPGKQRGYILYFGSAKQSQTRTARIEKCMPAIFARKGLHDDY